MENKIDIQNIKGEFDIFKNHPTLCYMDSGATSLKPRCVLDKMNEYYNMYGVNIHRGVYELSFKASNEFDIARSKVAKFINAKENEVVFTKNVSEALNEICLMLVDDLKEDDIVLTTELEHHSSVLPWIHASKKKNFKVDYIELDENNRITFDNFKKALKENTKVLAITLVSNVLGYVTDIKPIIEECKKRGIITIVDGAQAVQHFKIDVKEIDMDFFAFSGHKMFGPTGVGVMYGKEKYLKQLDPVYYGGDMMDTASKEEILLKDTPHRYEVGTLAIAEVIGLGEAIDFIERIGFSNIQKKESELRDYLFNEIKKVDGLTIYNLGTNSPILCFNINYCHPHDAITMYDEDEICLRAGHHCAELLSKHLKVNGTLRASLSIYNTKDDIDRFVKKTKYIVDFFKDFF